MRRGGTADGLGSRFRRPAAAARGGNPGSGSPGKGAAGAGQGPRRRSEIGEVIFEFWPAGRYVKVSAMHPRTLTEVSIVGDATRSQSELEELALQKLRYVLARQPR